MASIEPSEESIFALALEKPNPAERLAFVEGACVGHPTLFATSRVCSGRMKRPAAS